MIPESFIQELLNRVDVIDVIEKRKAAKIEARRQAEAANKAKA